MIDTVACLLGESFRRASVAAETSRTLDELPDNLLSDIGIVRSEIPFVARSLATLMNKTADERPKRFCRSAGQGLAPRMWPRVVLRLVPAGMIGMLAFVVSLRAACVQDGGFKSSNVLRH